MASNKWIAHESVPENKKVNIFCFPHAGGTAAYFAQMGNCFGGKAAVLPIQYPMREKRIREKLPDSVSELAKDIVDNCLSELKSGPFVFLGHCSGSLIAYEAALYAKETYNLSPSYLIASSTVAPDKYTVEQLSNLPKKELIEYIKVNSTVDEQFFENEMMIDYFLPIVRKDFKIQEEYRCIGIRKVDCSILVMGGSDDQNLKNKDDINRWSEFTDREFSSVYFPGDHFYMNNNLQDVCDFIKEKLNF